MGALVDLAKPIEGAVGQLDTLVADRKSAIGIIDNGYQLADRRFSLLARLQNEDHLENLKNDGRFRAAAAGDAGTTT